jgi:hypothetical protein
MLLQCEFVGIRAAESGSHVDNVNRFGSTDADEFTLQQHVKTKAVKRQPNMQLKFSQISCWNKIMTGR